MSKKSKPKLTILARASKEAPPQLLCPLYASPIMAGPPTQGFASIEEQLDLHRYCIKNPPATFFLRVEGHSMQNLGIHQGDILVVDRSAEIRQGRVVIAAINGELTVKQLICQKQAHGGETKEALFLASANPDYPWLEITSR
ncbi:MAG: error-prone repair protein UmuD, partial [Desulfovibrio sp.]|nr:error-prone repair protein UmuD [Desulfovibrio sp.]